MNDLKFFTICTQEEVEILRDRVSFNYRFDSSTIELLKKNLELENSLYLLVKRGEDFTAFCSVDQDWWEENHFFIREILVAPEFHKKGIGEDLMKKCIDHARKKGAFAIVTETDFANIPMVHLCKKLGFLQWENPQWNEGLTFKLML